ncbi:protein-transporting protein BCP1 KNAG_0C05020 [Huiozyma naganishii CBS 8797]|uniref:Protein BCP1 n=1 Tax=Huiozyma naganishii (strain ATCC MYA-139 / BCRC 22969 / CBS 8797 / KCTC 17520 / NBRC 10181 / NCYC 3082 / Yp74L-3) TaxID=1071383 RepID=J7RJA5_HUIN7|nr:hypothetical protein KNAG_0C05020 [Kazachstania naganishii CBS 8797]CCK69603.1 hypothetical protein KNAG_0C05020 [Kazachstania naganishii CBS 8797]
MVKAVLLSDLAAQSRKRRSRNDAGDADQGSSDSEIDISSTDSETNGDGDGDGDRDSGDDIVNIDFDFYNANPEVDFHALKNLSRQLFGLQESNRIQLSALAHMMLDSPMTTIKTDGEQSDPYCFLAVVDYAANKNSDYASYLKKVDPKLAAFFQAVENNGKSCALVLSERLINMPPEVVPPMYRITLEDVSSALGGEDKHYDFYVIASRKYEVNFDMDDDENDEGATGRSKKRVKNDEIDFFHEEDRFFEPLADLYVERPVAKGVIPTFTVLSHSALLKGVDSLETEMSQW